MSNTPETYRTLTPYLVVSDADAELRFLAAAFGATEKMCARAPDVGIMHAELMVGDSMVMVGQANEQWKALSGSIFLWVDHVDESYRKALDAGAKSLRTPQDMPYGQRTAGVEDGCGITWWICSPVKS